MVKLIKEIDKSLVAYKTVNKKAIKRKKMSVVNIILFVLVIEAVIVNQFIISAVNANMGIGMYRSKMMNGASVELSGDLSQDVVKMILVKGVPAVYGSELGINFDQVQAAINVMRQFDPTYGQRKIVLSADKMKRYIDIGLRISCEYCCSAKSIVFGDGRAACGCAHSQAMRGLSAYLLQYHGGEYSNDEILRELAQWKGLYFPKQMMKKLATQLSGAAFTPDTASLVMDMDLPDYGGDGSVPLPSEIEGLPSMVGGC